MPEPAAPALIVPLLASCAGLLVLLLLLVFRIFSRLSRIEKLLSGRTVEMAAPAPSVAETSSGGAFEAFLSEDPSRRNLPKSEQFSAYRRWRQEKGMNWSNS